MSDPPALRRRASLPRATAIAALACVPLASHAQAPPPSPIAADGADPLGTADAPTRSLGVVSVTGMRPTSLPTQIPTTTESATREQIERTVNATDAEDALKYLPSLLVRKRYPGDYNHAVLSSRASGTGNSARSAVYADGILLSNFLGNGVGGLSFPPRWGMVTPEEIDRVDVMYGPFSAAYPGNSVGAVVDYVTRMPTRLEAHAKVGVVSQPFELYRTDAHYRAWEESASIGNRNGQLTWWVNVDHLDSTSQPLTFATRLVNATVATPGVPVTGAVLDANNAGQPWWVVGSGTQYHSRQDHLKVKLAYDLAPTVRASYLFGLWRNRADGDSQSYLRDASGAPVESGPISIGGQNYAPLTGADFALTREELQHTMHGLSIKSHGGGEWDGEFAASVYDYGRDDKRQNSAANVLPGARSGGPGTLADGSGTGWSTLALKGTWRPPAAGGAHVVDFGLQQERYVLRYLTSILPGNYLSDDPGALASNVHGRTSLQSAWAQDVWRFAERWTAVVGGRFEHWQASEGRTDFSATSSLTYPERREEHFSPKAALSWQWRDDTLLKASLGRAVRNPTVAELYGATSTANSQFVNDPDLRPERSWTAELSAERDLGRGSARLTFFAEDTRDALYSQTTLDPVANRNITRVQNVERIATRGIEGALQTHGWLVAALDLAASVTYTDSKIKENSGFVAVPGDTIGKWQPNVPRWRATALASWRFDERWSASVAARLSGRQYRTLDNADVNGFTYQGVSKFATIDVRAVYRFARNWTAAIGVDNLNDDHYWNFHPYPQRSYVAELKFDH
jgi:iron complex outermembrane receptor protein